MASVSTNKLGTLAEQSVEETAGGGGGGAPKLEAMVEVQFKVRGLAVLLKAEESNVTSSKNTKTSKSLGKVSNNNSKSEAKSLGLAMSASGPVIMSAATVVAKEKQRLQYEAKELAVERTIESTTCLMGHSTESDLLRNEAVQPSIKVELICDENPVHDWGVPNSFVVELPRMLSFEQHLKEAKRLENALVLVRPAKFIVFPQILRERILALDVLEDTKRLFESSKTTNTTTTATTTICRRKSLASLEFSQSSVKSTIIKTSKLQEIRQHENLLQVEKVNQTTTTNKQNAIESSTSDKVAEVDDQVINLKEEESQENILIKQSKQKREEASSLATTVQTLSILQPIKANFQNSMPQKFEKTLTAALDLALLGQTKFQLKWKRSDELCKSALKCHAKAQLKWPFRDCSILETTRSTKAHFSKWETSESLQLLKKQKRVSTRLDFLAQEKPKIFPTSTVETKVDHDDDDDDNVKMEVASKMHSGMNEVKMVDTSSKSTFFDLQVIDDDNDDDGRSLSVKDSDEDCFSDTRSSPETFCAEEDDLIIGNESNETLANDVGFLEGLKKFDITEELNASPPPLKPVITHDKFLMQLLEDLSTPEDAMNGQEVQLLYLRKTPFIEDDEDLLLPAVKTFKEATTKPNKYLMELLNKKQTSEEDLIDIDAESDDWDEELDPDVDGIEFFDSEEHDYDVSESNDDSNATIQPAKEQQEAAESVDELSCVGTQILFGNITESEFRNEGQGQTKKKTVQAQENKEDDEIKPMTELVPLVALSRFHVVPNTPEPPTTAARKFPNDDDDDERPSCSKDNHHGAAAVAAAASNWSSSSTMKYKQMAENDKINYQNELQTVLKKIRLLSEVDELDQSCIYEEADTEQRLYMKKNGEWFATEPSESDEENRNEKRLLEKELPTSTMNPSILAASPRALISEQLSTKRFWMLSELRKRFGLKTAKYDPTKKRPGMIIDSEYWEEAYSESTFWNAHKSSFEKVRVLAKKGRFKFAIISEAKQNHKVETSDEGEVSDKSSSEDENKESGCRSLQRKHSSFEIRHTHAAGKPNDDGEVFFQPINSRGLFGAKCNNERRWALPPSRIYRFSRSFGRILKLYMKRPDLETILEEREPHEVEFDDECCEMDDVKESVATAPVSAAKNGSDLFDQPEPVTGQENNNLTKIRKKSDADENNENNNEEAAAADDDEDDDDDDDDELMLTPTVSCYDLEKHTTEDWYYCFYNDCYDEPIDEDYFGDLSDFD